MFPSLTARGMADSPKNVIAGVKVVFPCLEPLITEVLGYWNVPSFPFSRFADAGQLVVEDHQTGHFSLAADRSSHALLVHGVRHTDDCDHVFADTLLYPDVRDGQGHLQLSVADGLCQNWSRTYCKICFFIPSAPFPTGRNSLFQGLLIGASVLPGLTGAVGEWLRFVPEHAGGGDQGAHAQDTEHEALRDKCGGTHYCYCKQHSDEEYGLLSLYVHFV